MIDFDKELEAILADDPLDLLVVQPKGSSVLTSDERLISSFEEINAFVEEHGHEPNKSRDIQERRLYSRLASLRADPVRAVELIEFDRLDLLTDIEFPVEKEIKNIDNVLEDDFLGLLGGSDSDETDPEEIFILKNIPDTIDMPESIAKRKPCKEFENFEHLFLYCHASLKSGEKELRQFSGEQQISEGHFFILHGVMVYVAEVGEKEKKKGKANARLRCIFENGTESNMLLRSLATELYKDESGRRVLNPRNDLFSNNETITEKDKATGYIYILRSLSEDQAIKGISDLYKIGFSTRPTQQRIKNAAKEPTYLMADVKLVAEYETFNLNPQKLEKLLHTFFSEACLDLEIIDNKLYRNTPREWFVVPLPVIKTAIKLLINGDIVNYRFNSERQEITEK